MKFSIIIPVYNAEKHINECVASIINSTYTDYEILLIDDGSQDKSLDICQSLAKDNKSVRAFYQTNKGAASARNYGIAEAKGDFLAFVDSDDRVAENYIEKLNFYIDNYSFDVLWFNMRVVNESGVELFKTISIVNGFISKNDFLSCFFGMNLNIGSMCSKVYSKYFICRHGLKLTEGRIYGEDWDFNLRLGELNPKVLCVPDILYNYIKYDSRQTVSTKYFREDFDVYCESYSRLLNIAKVYGLSCSEREQGAIFVYNVISQLGKLMASSLSKKEKNMEYNRIIQNKTFHNVLISNRWDSRFMSKRQCVVSFLLKKNIKIAKFVMSL